MPVPPPPLLPRTLQPGSGACVCLGPNQEDGQQHAHVCTSFSIVVTQHHRKEEGQFASQVEVSVPPGADLSCQEAWQLDASTRLCLFFPFPSIWASAR